VKDQPEERRTYLYERARRYPYQRTRAAALGRRIARSQAAGTQRQLVTLAVSVGLMVAFSQMSAGHVIEVVKQEATKHCSTSEDLVQNRVFIEQSFFIL
jgi:hypothetical protein